MDDIKRLEDRISKLEEKQNHEEKQSIANKYELQSLIKEAVHDGNKESIKMFEKLEIKFDRKFNELEKRTYDLENAEAKMALERKKEVTKIIVSTIVGFVVLGFITNLFSLFSDLASSNERSNVNVEEIDKNN